MAVWALQWPGPVCINFPNYRIGSTASYLFLEMCLVLGLDFLGGLCFFPFHRSGISLLGHSVLTITYIYREKLLLHCLVSHHV